MDQLKGIIFDLDGTLANTYLDFPQMCRDAGLPEGTRILEHCAALNDEARVLEILAIVEQHEMQGALRAEWILDAKQILDQFAQEKIPMAIVTRNMREAANSTVEKLKIPIEYIITREDCAPKPDPQGLLKVASQWGIPPAQLIYVGDYKFDLIAANSAGMMSCLLANQNNSQFNHLADETIVNFKQLHQLYSDKQIIK
jgi:HAD superfamily hydrolase (TIGR01549 family)